ncbi:GGDEF domain-containing protein [Kineococcus gynurae]|uniref:GGDEF domain-containing protein n=1 Tax=Kineococcus gynurae TaxID=452979 RepID=A0ABV5LST0_9ACTN
MLRTWRWTLPALLCAAAVVLPAFHPGPVARFPVAVAPPLLLLGVGLVGSRRAHPVERCGWRWISIGAGFLVVGFVIFHVLWLQQGHAVFPSLAEPFFAAGWLALIVGLYRWGRGAERTLLSDSVVLALGPGLVVLSQLVRPLLARADSVEIFVTAAFPLLDLVLLVMVVRLGLQGRMRIASVALISTGCGLLLVGDTLLTVLYRVTDTPLVYWFGAPTSIAVSLMAASGLVHPAGARYGTEFGDRIRLTLLPIAACVPPVALFLQGLAGHPVDWQLLGGGSVLMAVLITFRLRGALRTMGEQSRRLRREASTDHLTGLANRRSLAGDLDQVFAHQEFPRVAVILLDLDHFKAVNDRFGHERGDQVLQACSAAWAGVLHRRHPRSTLYRWGGEEFLALVHEVGVRDALSLAEALREATPIPNTVSAGVAVLRPGETTGDLLARADRELYRAKQSGRDRVCV